MKEEDTSRDGEGNNNKVGRLLWIATEDVRIIYEGTSCERIEHARSLMFANTSQHTLFKSNIRDERAGKIMEEGDEVYSVLCCCPERGPTTFEWFEFSLADESMSSALCNLI